MSQRLFLDTNIILDLLGERHPFYLPIAKIATLAEKEMVELISSPIAFATVNYLLTKYENAQAARDKLRKFKVLCTSGNLNDQIVDMGLNSSFTDFEDALQYYCALHAGCGIIITRNGQHFKASALPVMTAEEFLISFSSQKN